jgi:hypothetical protein
MKDIFTVSSSPLVFMHSDKIYIQLIKNLNAKLKDQIPTPFEFENSKGERIKERYRFSFPISEIGIENELNQLLKNFASNIVPEFLKKLKKHIKNESYKLNKKNKLKYCLRVRLFEDKKGYSLQPHRDSADTIFSFILQLDSKNSITNLYKESQYFKIKNEKKINEEESKFKVLSLISKIQPDEKIYFGESQFRKNLGIWTDKKFYRYENNYEFIDVLEFEEKEVNIKEHSIYAICNSLNGPFNSSILDAANKISYHGVRPVQQECRRLLIMDLITEPTEKNILIMNGVNTDKNSYFMIYGPEKCLELTDLLS